MRNMTRGLALLTALVATLAVALPATAAEGRSLKGVLVSVSATSVAVKDAKNVVTTCARVAKSPSLDGFAAGDRVEAACVRAGGKLVLAKLRRLAAKSGPGTNDAEPTKFGGAVTALSSSSITLRDGDRNFTCTIDASSPSTGEVKVGQHVKVSCSNGVLVAIAPVSVPSGDKPKSQTGAGTISALSTTSVTFHNEERDVTCSLAAASPRLGDYHVGDKVKFGCLGGALVAIAKTDSGKVDGPHKTVGAAGTVSAVSATSLTVHTDGGDVTCSVGDGSPSVATVHVGDKVKIGCLDGVLKVLARSDTVSGSGDGHTATTAAGTLTALSSSSVTVHGEHGDVTCSVPATARLGDFHVGDRVGMACVDGALLKLVKLT
jgi:hypothetical protein